MQINFNLMQISRKAGTAGDKRILLIFLGNWGRIAIAVDSHPKNINVYVPRAIQ